MEVWDLTANDILTVRGVCQRSPWCVVWPGLSPVATKRTHCSAQASRNVQNIQDDCWKGLVVLWISLQLIIFAWRRTAKIILNRKLPIVSHLYHICIIFACSRANVSVVWDLLICKSSLDRQNYPWVSPGWKAALHPGFVRLHESGGNLLKIYFTPRLAFIAIILLKRMGGVQ